MNDLSTSNPEGEYPLTDPPGNLGGPASSFRIQRLWIFLLKLWWVPVLTSCLSLAAAVCYAIWMPPTYVSRARMWETVKLHLPEGSLFSEDMQNFLGTQTELLQSGPLRALALARLNSSSSNRVTVPIGKDGEPLPVTVRVAQASKSDVFELDATSSRDTYTTAYLNALMQVYLEYKRNVRQVVSGDTLASISEQVARAERDLKVEQENLIAFERTNNIAILQEEGTISGGYLAKLKTQLSDLELEDQLLKSSASEKGAASTNANIDTELLNTTGSDGVTKAAGAPSERQNASQEIELLKIQREKLSKFLRPKHPKIVKLDADIQRSEKLLEIIHRQNREQIEASRRDIQLRIQNVQGAVTEWENKVVEANSRIGEAERLKVNVQRQQGIYDRLSLLVQNVGISRNIDQETLAILEPATTARRTFVRESSALALGAILGLVLGLGIIALIGIRDDRFTSVIEVNASLSENIVGQVPAMPALPKDHALPLLQIDDQRHAYAESYRSLRSALQFMPANGERPKLLLVTSAVPHEGKSTVAANLARTLSLGGSRVILVDGDIRRGVLHQLLGLQREPGLADLLKQTGELEKFIQHDPLLNFAFIASGSISSRTGDLFVGTKFDEILAQLRQQFDYIVIDSSPVFASDDSSTLAPKVDGTLFVVRSGFSRPGPTRQALDLLYQRQARVLGLVLNQVDVSKDTHYYYKYADYYGTAQPESNGKLLNGKPEDSD